VIRNEREIAKEKEQQICSDIGKYALDIFNPIISIIN
jgi:hypothetical protein